MSTVAMPLSRSRVTQRAAGLLAPLVFLAACNGANPSDVVRNLDRDARARAEDARRAEDFRSRRSAAPSRSRPSSGRRWGGRRGRG
jgi:hypothetical protein